ncbi:MAG TPA: hypothetical protein VLF16_04200 [Pseudomonas sp.]|nr:hypothetical protein [Pseudomonas sp.]
MQISPSRALVLSLLLALINGPALVGNGKITGGGVARTIETNQKLARNLELEEQLRRGSDTPPGGDPDCPPAPFMLA